MRSKAGSIKDARLVSFFRLIDATSSLVGILITFGDLALAVLGRSCTDSLLDVIGKDLIDSSKEAV